MKERLECEFFLIRYVPDVVKGEFTNIGVVLREAGGGRDGARGGAVYARLEQGALHGRRTRMWSCWSRWRERLQSGCGWGRRMTKPVMEVLEDTLSNSVQMTEVRACLAESMPAEMEQLMRMYVEPLKVKVERKRTGRAAIAGAMRTEFERAGVWGLMRKRIAAATYTRAGDPMRIDCGYRATRKSAQWGDSDVSGGVAGG